VYFDIEGCDYTEDFLAVLNDDNDVVVASDDRFAPWSESEGPKTLCVGVPHAAAAAEAALDQVHQLMWPASSKSMKRPVQAKSSYE
jgi:hypothetical protein